MNMAQYTRNLPRKQVEPFIRQMAGILKTKNGVQITVKNLYKLNIIMPVHYDQNSEMWEFCEELAFKLFNKYEEIQDMKLVSVAVSRHETQYSFVSK